MIDIPFNSRTTRRSFLDFMLGIGLTGWAVTVFYPILRYLKPLPSTGASGPIRLSANDTAQIDRERFVILRAGPKRLLVFRDASEKLRALDAKCTHEGCTVQYVPGESVVWCACHNGRFDLDGRVISGPPPRPLPRYAVQTDPSGAIIVNTEQA